MRESIDEIWEKIHKNRSWGGYPAEYVIRFVARNYYNQKRRNVRILDFGCGQGAHTWYLAREGFDTYAFDGAESAVRKTREKLESEGFKAAFKVSDAVSLDYPDDFFDAVIDNVCVCSNRMDDIRWMYDEIFSMLKPGGKLLTVAFGKELDGYKTGEEIEPGTYQNICDGVLKDRGISHIYGSKDELTELLRNIGFNNIQYEWSKYTDMGNLVHQYICSAEK